MDALLSVKPGLLIWTVINFGLFLFLLNKFGGKPIANALKSREQKIADAIAAAEAANAKAEALLIESTAKIDSAQAEVAQMLAKGREQAEAQIKRATEEADKVKREKLEDAKNEIERSKQAAINQLRSEVANLVVDATEKIIGDRLDSEKDIKIIENYIEKLPKN